MDNSIIVSLEWAKKLEIAGWLHHDARFCWCRWGMDKKDSECTLELTEPEECGGAFDVYAAPTAEEILRRFPGEVIYIQGKCYLKINHLGHGSFYLNIKRANPKRIENGERVRLPKSVWSTQNDSLANAAAAMYCYLKEHNLVPPTA